jgi:hypothetical protein
MASPYPVSAVEQDHGFAYPVSAVEQDHGFPPYPVSAVEQDHSFSLPSQRVPPPNALDKPTVNDISLYIVDIHY